jgi:hypothetical protein
MAAIADLGGITVPTMDAVVTLASVLLREDLRATGRGLACMIPGNLSTSDIRHYVLN